MIPVSDIMNKFLFYLLNSLSYHDKKRRIEYFRIARDIEEENKKNPDKPPKGIVGDKPEVKRESQENTPCSVEGKEKFFGNLLGEIT
jgi:hypothetical protein